MLVVPVLLTVTLAALLVPAAQSLAAPLPSIHLSRSPDGSSDSSVFVASPPPPTASPRSSVTSSLLDTFAPAHTPPRGYARYAVLNQVQNLLTAVRNTLSSLFILSAYADTSQASAVALTATLAFISRDAAGMLATLGFSRLAPAFSLSSDLKRWR